jgi:hypothetical protein
VGDASPAYSGLGRWWYCRAYLLHVTCVCTMHVTVHWRWESLFQGSNEPGCKYDRTLSSISHVLSQTLDIMADIGVDRQIVASPTILTAF